MSKNNKKTVISETSKERTPLQPSHEDEEEKHQDNLIDDVTSSQPISIPLKWINEYDDPSSFEENEQERQQDDKEQQDQKSIYFTKNDKELFSNLMNGCDWCSMSEYFNTQNQAIKVASQLTAENANDGNYINFMSYSQISLSNQLSSIFQLVIKLINETNQSNNSGNNLLQYPWNLIYPQNNETNLPVVSQNGLYFVKLYYCGEWRSIMIDDCIPMFDDKFMFPMIADSNEIWTQILSKAILKFLIISNRLNNKLCIPLIIQLLTSVIPANISEIDTKHFDDNIIYKYVTNLDKQSLITSAIELDKITNWTTITSLNNFSIDDKVIENKEIDDCWIAVYCAEYYKQSIQDLWMNNNCKTFKNDKSIIISNEDSEINIILQINSLNQDLEEEISLCIYDEINNIQKCIQKVKMNNGFVSIITNIKPHKIYFIETTNNISYSASLYSSSNKIHIKPRFGDEQIWKLLNYSLINIESNTKYRANHQTFILFNIHIKLISDDCNVLFHSIINNKSLEDSLVIYCVNLDNQNVTFIPNLNLSKFSMQKNNNGYSLVAFCKPNTAIPNTPYEIKIMYTGEIEHNMIDMSCSLNFLIHYKPNFDLSLMRDEIVSDNNAQFMFVELCFQTTKEYNDFGKLIEFIDKNTNKIVASYSSTQPIIYIPQMFIKDSSLWFSIKFDKSDSYSQLNKDNSVQCTIRIISDETIRLFPDTSQQLEFEKIKESWQTTKGRGQTAKQTRQKYLQKQSTSNISTKKIIIKKNENKKTMNVDDSYWKTDDIKRSKLLQAYTTKIESQKQFRSNQNDRINNHILYIEESQKMLFQNMQQITENDTKQRSDLRVERLAWNKKLSDMNSVFEQTKANFNNFKQILTDFNADTDKIMENIENEPENSKKKQKKRTVPSKNLSIPNEIPSLIDHCKNICNEIPSWVYGNNIKICSTSIHKLLYDVIKQINQQFSTLINNKNVIKGFGQELFKEFSQKYTNLCFDVFESITIVKEWKQENSKQLIQTLQFVQNECEDLIVDSHFNELQSIMKNDKSSKDQENDSDANQNSPSIDHDIKEVLECFNKIPFVDDSKTMIVINDYNIKLKSKYLDYTNKVQQWIKETNQTTEIKGNENL